MEVRCQFAHIFRRVHKGKPDDLGVVHSEFQIAQILGSERRKAEVRIRQIDALVGAGIRGSGFLLAWAYEGCGALPHVELARKGCVQATA